MCLKRTIPPRYAVLKRNFTQLFNNLRHNGPVWSISWAHPRYGNILASCSFDRKVCVWKETKANEWAEVTSHEEHQGSVNTIAWAPWECGLVLAAASTDKTVSILRRN